MEQRRRICLKKSMYQEPFNPFITMIKNASTIIMPNMIFDSQLTSWSSREIFTLGIDMFIAIRVSLPVYMTIPYTVP